MSKAKSASVFARLLFYLARLTKTLPKCLLYVMLFVPCSDFTTISGWNYVPMNGYALLSIVATKVSPLSGSFEVDVGKNMVFRPLLFLNFSRETPNLWLLNVMGSSVKRLGFYSSPNILVVTGSSRKSRVSHFF